MSEVIFSRTNVGSTRVSEDNKGAIQLTNNPVTTRNSEFIDVHHHFLRERVANGEFKVIHVPSAQQHTDFSPKHCPRRRFVFTAPLW